MVEVGEQVVDVFDAGAVADEAFGDAERFTFGGRTFDVAGGCWWAHDRLDCAEVCGHVGKAQSGEERPNRCQVAAEAEAEHAAEAAHLLGGDVVVWVRGQPRVVDADHLGVSGQILGHRGGVLVLPFDAQAQRLHATEQQVGGLGMKCCAVDLAVGVDGVDEVFAANGNPAKCIGVTTEKLSGRMHDEVGTEVDWRLVDGCRKRVVDHNNRPGSMARSGQPFEVEDLERGVGWGLEV